MVNSVQCSLHHSASDENIQYTNLCIGFDIEKCDYMIYTVEKLCNIVSKGSPQNVKS